MISVTHFRDSGAQFEAQARQALESLGQCPGFVGGRLGRSTDDTADWVLVTEWRNVGSYRRALGRYDVKMRATPLLATALDLPSSFESLFDVHAGTVSVHTSDHA